ncbi:SigE family RNA polymerase sigma factor [Bailinhaonella thermotolerans]|uniref:SigE family RNA polymerase sigma factor n=1 Tax=Bailinhaonella thermotolerans TaxID=1070861 RepID=A0A3A4AY49_9ACTN|nr:SigE family RNA polymerase sigma factor [Bailinhaonella thermotolerans]RJL30763.1 SigE family RNA polymerase sigma factor [Bailinhaonella thermotolerans]
MRESYERSFDEFVAARSTSLMRIAYLVCGGSHHDAEDLLQGALEKLYRHWDRVSADDPEPYARRVLVNAAISRARRRRLLREVNVAAPPDTPVPEDHSVHLRSVLVAELLKLPPRQRAVLVLRYWLDLSEAETAAALRCSTGSVKSQASRGLARLRTYLDPSVFAEVTG